MDNINQLDTSVYKIDHQKCGNIGLVNISYDQNIKKNGFKQTAKKHKIITTKKEFKNIYNKNDFILFYPSCEYTGLHWHSIYIFVRKDGGDVKKTKHSAHGDGSLSYPHYDAFLISKLNYFEENYKDTPIYIHKAILKKEDLDKEYHYCFYW